MTERVPATRFHDDLEGWRVLCDGATAFFRTDTLATSATFIVAISDLPGVEDHKPDIDVRPDGVTVRLLTNTDDFYGTSTMDFELARLISDTARDLGLGADPSVVQSVLVIPGALDTTAVMPFWQAVLGYERRPDSPDEDLRDPRRRGPFFWFERMDEPRADGGGTIHLAVCVPHDQAEARIAAALAAGGRMVRDQDAPEFWTLADAAGNQVDIA
jgi:4a-hydroxytetrahydrobiopterin dehydratase